MTLKVLFISLTGILVVFGFLFIMYIILSSFRYFFYNRKRIPDNEEIQQREIAVVLCALNHYHRNNLSGAKIIIKRRR